LYTILLDSSKIAQGILSRSRSSIVVVEAAVGGGTAAAVGGGTAAAVGGAIAAAVGGRSARGCYSVILLRICSNSSEVAILKRGLDALELEPEEFGEAAESTLSRAAALSFFILSSNFRASW
jgi:hypothetical protein